MNCLHRDFETRSTLDLAIVGAWHYAAEPTTDILCVGYAVDDAPPRIWRPGQPVPEEFVEAARDPGWTVIAHNDQFETAIEQRLLGPRYGWPQVPIERHRCTMAMILAVALPAALENATAALELPFHKDRDGQRLMRKLARRRAEEPGADELERLHEYCQRDVEVERALFHRLPALLPAEQELWTLDQKINARGFHVDRQLAEAARKLTVEEQIAIDQAVSFLTQGEITSANQVARITKFVRERGHQLKSLGKRSIAAILARAPGEDVRRLLELRRDGSRAAARKLDALLAGLDADDRLRGTLRFCGAATGRWSGSRFQPQNLKKPETKNIDAAVDAILVGDLPRIRELGAPLAVVGDVSRATICAAPGRVLIGADFSAIESRVLAWIAGETWKLESYRRFDAIQDPADEPYCKTASLILRRLVTPDDEAGRSVGKVADLSFGYGGGLGAWRRFDNSDTYSDAAVEQFKLKWRSAHKATVRFWRALENGLRRALRTRQRITLGNLASEVDQSALYLTLPSGRRLAYPQARLEPGKFGEQIVFKDNARGGWSDARGWHGTFTENVVQAISRDLLAVAMLRLDAAGYLIVLHVHDELVAEVPEDFGSVDEFVQLMITLPDWATGLPIAAKGWRRQRYAKPATGTSETPPAPSVEAIAAAPRVTPEPKPERPRQPIVSLAGLFGPLTNGKMKCPFHQDATPSCHIYEDGHFHCFGCDAHGDALDWLVDVEGMVRDDAIALLAEWQGQSNPLPNNGDDERSLKLALGLWHTAQPIIDTPAVKYLVDIRGIDVDALPADAPLRFHPHCPFGPGLRAPALIALYRDVVTDAPAGIHRIALTPDVLTGAKVQRLSLGRWAAPRAIKLWPAADQLFVGEGIETVLAAATRLQHRGAPMRPAWAAGSESGLSKLPVIAGVDRLIILADNDVNGIGQAAAQRCAERWSRAGRTAIKLVPKRPGADFNDLAKEKAA